jgi:hypothetical protein
VPKKTKNLQNENSGANTKRAPLKTARRRTSTTTKKSKAARKTPSPGESAKTSARPKESSGIPPLTNEEIQLRAYFISERRHRLGLAGDSNSDWLEAKRQLLSEVGPR